MEDNQIIDLFFLRDQQAIAETDRKYNRYLQAIACRILGNREDAEECVNDALNSAWNNIPPQRPAVFRMFLAKLTRNRAINRYKEEHTKKRGSGEMTIALEELNECVAGGSEPEKTVLAEELSKEIRAFVRSLPEREGDVFLRRYFFLEDVKSVALRYGISQNNASVILNRTRKKLRDHLKNRHFL